MISVLLVDDHSLIRMGFRLVLDAESDIEVVGEAADGTAAVAMCSALRPDVVLMDVRMPGHDGIEATRDIVAAGLPCRVLILTTFDLDDYVYAGLRAGASGFLLKDTQPTDLVAAIRTIAAGDAVLAPAATSRLVRQFAATPPGGNSHAHPPNQPGDGGAQIRKTLTDREQDVFSRIAAGMSNSEIAASLFLSEGTVKIHVGRILAKLGLRDRVQAVVLAYESRLITPGTPPPDQPGPPSTRAVPLRGEIEWRVAIGEEADVGLHPQRVAVGADQEAPDALGVLPGEQDGEEAGDDGRARRDGQGGQHEVLGDGQEPLVQRLPLRLLPAIGRSWAVMGHSQGGHAALFTASLAPAWVPDLDLIGAVAIAPIGGAHDLIAGLRDARTPAPTLGFLALILVGATAADHTVRVDQLLTPAALHLLAKAEVVGIDDLLAPGSPAPLVPAEVFRPGADLGPLLKVLAANDPAMLRPRTPVLIVQGNDDPIVARRGTDHIARSLHASGAMLFTTGIPAGATTT